MDDQVKAIKNLLLEHEAYQFNIKTLVSSIDKIASLFEKLPTPEDIESAHDGLQNLCSAFEHTRDILISHESRDLLILKDLVEKHEMDEMNADHDIINKAIDRMQNELYDLDHWNIDQIKEHTINLQKGILEHQAFVTNHIIRENKLLKRNFTD